ncbi:MAG: haloacid dehalogenase-like hydrolase [Atopobiaceae bacterium]|nr:haloacid dehalogenase-like hydrolase [Atopobiaceae bacterium]
MNVYDFDGTIFHSNCTVGFGMWCIRRHPKLLVTYVPGVVWSFARYKLGRIKNFRMQRELFKFLTMIDDFDEQIERYWDAHEAKISPWYLEQKRPDDLIMSSSPMCIIGPIARRLGVNYVATDYDRELGVLLDNLMYAKEKARYIFDHGFPVIDNFYSDSLADTPLALCAEKAHMVINGGTTVVDWPELDPKTIEKIRKEIDTGWSIHLSEDVR